METTVFDFEKRNNAIALLHHSQPSHRPTFLVTCVSVFSPVIIWIVRFL